MGYYINPTDGRTKEQWLEEEGDRVSRTSAEAAIDMNITVRPVCLVNNGMFTAAGICYNKQEFEAFASPDGRPKMWYLVTIDKLRPFCSIL